MQNNNMEEESESCVSINREKESCWIMPNVAMLLCYVVFILGVWFTVVVMIIVRIAMVLNRKDCYS